MGEATDRSAWRGGVLRKVGAVVVFAGLVMSLLPLVAGAEHIDTWPATSEANAASFWEAWGLSQEGEGDWTCFKVETGDDDPFEVGSPPPDEVWRLLVVKAGAAVNELHWNPLPGAEFEHSIQGGWSHVILCSVPEEDEETTTTVEDETTTTVEDETTTTVEDETTTTVEDETTTTVEDETTTTVEDETTTTDPGQITTTTIGATTSTVADEVLPIVVTTSTVAPTSTVADEVEGTQVVAVTLPFTGPATEGFGQLGLALLALGALLLAATRSREAAADE